MKPHALRCAQYFDSNRLAGNSPRQARHLLLRRQKKVPQEKATLVPLRPERAAPAVLRLGGVSLNSLRSNKREPSSAQPCAPRQGHKGTQPPKGCLAACAPRAPRARWGRVARRWPTAITTESIAMKAHQVYQKGLSNLKKSAITARSLSV